MLKRICFWCLLAIFSTVILAQNNVRSDDAAKVKGKQIIEDARKSIGIYKVNLNSYKLRTKTVLDSKLGETIDETSVLLPDKIQTAFVVKQPAEVNLTRIWNGEKYKALYQFEALGNVMTKDVTNSSLNEESTKALEGRIDKDKLEKLKKFKPTDPKVIFYNKVWEDTFPLILANPFEQDLEFIYVGKAKSSADRFAEVVDVRSRNNRNYRLLFDTEMNYLLMMIVSFKGSDGDYETKHYYSNREKIGGVLIPKTIKVENKHTPTGESPRISHLNIEIEDFGLNPEFKKNMFDIK